MKYADYACAWTMFVTAAVFLLVIEIWRPPGAVFDTPLFWIPVAMLNFLRLSNRHSTVKSLRTFCIAANLMVFSLEFIRLAESAGWTFKSWAWLYLLISPLRLLQHLTYSLVTWWRWSPYPIIAVAALGESAFSLLQKDVSTETSRA
jgi:hypothetical protein